MRTKQGPDRSGRIHREPWQLTSIHQPWCTAFPRWTACCDRGQRLAHPHTTRPEIRRDQLPGSIQTDERRCDPWLQTKSCFNQLAVTSGRLVPTRREALLNTPLGCAEPSARQPTKPSGRGALRCGCEVSSSLDACLGGLDGKRRCDNDSRQSSVNSVHARTLNTGDLTLRTGGDRHQGTRSVR